MNRHNVTSALFSSAGYDATTGVLELEYRNGACRRWLAVPERFTRRSARPQTATRFSGPASRGATCPCGAASACGVTSEAIICA
ncbi:KTSC domain-containing protein [Pantoea agglomerans]|uniref:KTSC domain-containing protein n=1 Tax=Enterobacter agglomerans TaxID=549 RepID=UPI0037CCB63F